MNIESDILDVSHGAPSAVQLGLFEVPYCFTRGSFYSGFALYILYDEPEFLIPQGS
jgi:hypothetical protein